MRIIKILLLTAMSFFSAASYGQSTIKGVVLDSENGEPLPFATVYINGTTKGTTTDDNGRFELTDVPYPSTVVFSYVGYTPQALDFIRYPGELIIKLKTNELPEVVISKTVDKKDLDYFKTMFLGNDRWGQSATIKNEKVLMFDNEVQVSNYVRHISKTRYGNEYLTNNLIVQLLEQDDTVEVSTEVFTAWAYEPLIIDLPLLGYTLNVDLVKFTIRKQGTVTTCDILGYFYYKPYEKTGKRKSKRIEENRKRAYWGSSQHFLRSLYDNSLSENGFSFSVWQRFEKHGKAITKYIPLDVESYTTLTQDSIMLIHGLQDRILRIRYYHEQDGSPRRYNQYGLHLYAESGMNMLQDTCSFLKYGTLFDNNIRFTGDISKKRVGCCLPADYFPPVDSTRITVSDNADYTSEMMRFVDSVNIFNKMFPQEKIYLEFDNTAYFQGEDIWYKAFVRDATSLEQAPSQVLYVDFLTPTGKVIQQQRLKVVNGQADGKIPLLDTGTQQSRDKRGITAYPSGFYEVRAYTQNMLDFSPEAIFSRVIPVYTQPKYVGEYNRSHVESGNDNPLMKDMRTDPQDKPQKLKDVNVTFYPEGGNLIYGLPCRVAFKATGSDAFSIDGALIVPGYRDSVLTVHDGMGSFIITPDPNPLAQQETNVRFIPKKGNSVKLKLPNALYDGYSMMTDILSDSLLQVSIWRSRDHYAEKTALAAICRGEVIYFKEIKDLDESHFNIDCSDWPAGVCRLTLFNNEGRILSSRSIFHNKEDNEHPVITLNTDSLSHDSFGKEVLELKLTGKNGNPLQDSFCLAVRDGGDYGTGRSENLQTNLLLSSDLRGYIHDPAWYLESNDQEHREALDLLTLVQGWERYDWQTMTGKREYEATHRIEESLTLNGFVQSYRKRAPVSDIKVYAALMPKEDRTLFETFEYETDSSGYFGFNLSDFYGISDFSIHLMSTKPDGKNKYETGLRLKLKRADRPQPRPYLKQETDLNHNTFQLAEYKVDFSDMGLTPEQRKKLGMMIDDVDIEDKEGKVRFIDYDTFTSFDTQEETELEMDEGDYSPTLGDYFRDRGIIFGTEYDDKSLVDVIISTVKGEDVESPYTYVKPYFYIHNDTRFLDYGAMDTEQKLLTCGALDIDMCDVKSVLIYDKPMRLWEMEDLIYMEVSFRRDRQDYLWFDTLYTSMKYKYNLVDVHLKNNNELLFDWEKQNLGRRTTTVKGFNRPVQFYSPQYPDGPISGEIDSRRTLYWNPNVTTDYEGKARIEFYNNSFSKRFWISGAGITTYGVPYTIKQAW